MVEEATVDCYDKEEQVTGLYTLIEENLAVPFETHVLGMNVTVEHVELTDDGRVLAMCTRGQARQPIALLDLPLPTPCPAGVEWIEAYRHWASR